MEMNIEQVAFLARIKLQDGEKAKLSKDLENILGYVKQLNEINTQDIPATSHVLPIENVFRADEMEPQAVIEEALKHAPDSEGRFFKVPKIIEGE